MVRTRVLISNTVTVLLGTFIVNLAAFASIQDSCAKIDFSDKFGYTRDQMNTPWCYASVAADVASVALGFRVSSSDIAVTYDEKLRMLLREMHPPQRPQIPFEERGGSERLALLAANEKGFCPADLVEDNPAAKIPLSAWDIQLHGPYCGGPRDLDCMVNQIRLLKLRYDGMGDLAICEGKPGVVALQKIFPMLAQKNLSDVLQIISQEHTMSDLTDLACKGRRHSIPNLAIEELDFFNENCVSGETSRQKSACYASIDDQVTSKTPVILNGTINFLLQKQTPLQLQDKIAHAYLIVGRELRHGQCGFILRNSWGQDCPKDLDKRVECSTATGNYWVEKEIVLNETQGASWIKK